MRRGSVATGFAWVSFGRAVFLLSQWGVVVVLTKLGTAETVGLYVLGLSITAPVFLLAGLQLRSLQAVDVADTHSFTDYLALRIAAGVAGVAIVAAICLIAGYGGFKSAVILTIALLKFLDGLSDTASGLFIRHEAFQFTSVSLMVKGPLGLLCVGVVYRISGALIAALLSYVMVFALVFFLIDLRFARRLAVLQMKLDGTAMKKLACRSLPLAATAALGSLATTVPRYVLEHAHGVEALGYFGSLAYVFSAGNMVVNSLGQTISPRLARCYGDEKRASATREFRRILGRSVGVCFLFGAAALAATLLVGEQVLRVLYTPEHAEYLDVFVLLAGVAVVSFSASPLSYAMTAAGRLRVQPYLAGLSVAVVSALSMVAIPERGLFGACYAAAGAATVRLAAGAIVVARALKDSGRFGVKGDSV